MPMGNRVYWKDCLVMKEPHWGLVKTRSMVLLFHWIPFFFCYYESGGISLSWMVALFLFFGIMVVSSFFSSFVLMEPGIFPDGGSVTSVRMLDLFFF